MTKNILRQNLVLKTGTVQQSQLFVTNNARPPLDNTGQNEKIGNKTNEDDWPNSPPTKDEKFQNLIYSSATASSTSSTSLPNDNDVIVNNNKDIQDSPVLKQLNSRIQETIRKRCKYQNKVQEYNFKLTTLEQRKQQYLKNPNNNNSNIFSETTLRSATKAFLWRIIAGSITLITSLKLSNNNMLLALKVVGSDFFSKALTMFIGERIMNKSKAGRKNGSDSASRSIVKALIWRLFAISNTLIAVFFFGGGDLKLASKIAGSDAMFKTALMVFYERAWAKVEWGKDYTVDIESKRA